MFTTARATIAGACSAFSYPVHRQRSQPVKFHVVARQSAASRLQHALGGFDIDPSAPVESFQVELRVTVYGEVSNRLP